MKHIWFVQQVLVATMLACSPPMARIMIKQGPQGPIFQVKERHYVGNDAIWVEDITGDKAAKIDEYMWFVAFENSAWESKALQSFVYGEKFLHSEERTPAKPLVRGRKYRLVIHGTKGRSYNSFEWTEQ